MKVAVKYPYGNQSLTALLDIVLHAVLEAS
jgi:hypothetical protein